jgi:hypothetical protein
VPTSGYKIFSIRSVSRLSLKIPSSENGLYERSDADVNEHELIQGYGELYFKNALGFNRPLSVRAGRMAFEVLDRRLLAR